MQGLFSRPGSALLLSRTSTGCLYFAPRACAKLQREPSPRTRQMEWKRDSPQGEPHLARPVGDLLLGTAWREQPRLSAQLQRKMVPVTLIAWERKSSQSY